MNRPLLLDALGHALLATTLCGLALGLMVLPQRRLQRSMTQGVISLHVAVDGGLRLWNQPVAPAQLQRLLATPAMRRQAVRLRVVPDPGTPWGDVYRLLRQLDPLPLSVELQLPATSPSAG